MALSQYTIAEVRQNGTSTGASFFDPGQHAGMYTDGAATSATGTAPVFSSASYNFVAGDVGAWVYIYTGTDWIPGWYKIASVASNVATLTATIGLAVKLTTNGTIRPDGPSTTVGCATTSSPTGATWSIDYSQQDAVAFTYTDLASAGAGLTVSSAAQPFNKQHVGNGLNITSGTNFTAGRYVIASVAANVATVIGPGNITTGVGSGGNGKLGGGLNDLNTLQGKIVPGSYMYCNGTITMSSGCSITTAGTNSLPMKISGYGTTRGDGVIGRDKSTGLLITTNCATISVNVYQISIGNYYVVDSLNISTNVATFAFQGASYSIISFCKCTNSSTSANGIGIGGGTNNLVSNCDVYLTGVSGAAIGIIGYASSLVENCFVSMASAAQFGFYSNGVHAIFYNCITSGTGTGGTGNSGTGAFFVNCTFSRGKNGINFPSTTTHVNFISNCILTDNTDYGISCVATTVPVRLMNCRLRDNTLGNFNNCQPNADSSNSIGPIITADGGGPESDFVSASSANPLGYALIQQSPAYGVGSFGSNLGALPKGAGQSVLSPLSRGSRRKKLP